MSLNARRAIPIHPERVRLGIPKRAAVTRRAPLSAKAFHGPLAQGDVGRDRADGEDPALRATRRGLGRDGVHGPAVGARGAS